MTTIEDGALAACMARHPSASQYGRHALTSQPTDTLHRIVHYQGMAGELQRGTDQPAHVPLCPAADEPGHAARCSLDVRMAAGRLIRNTGELVGVAA